jgi:deoxyadenosine/deoxycytidine kinase
MYFWNTKNSKKKLDVIDFLKDNCPLKVNLPKMEFVVVVDGIIAAGKSVFVEMLKENLVSPDRMTGTSYPDYDVIVVKEPVQKWKDSGLLQRFYADPKRWAYHFQTMAFHDRVMENVNAYRTKRVGRNTIFILERSPYTDTLFMEMLHESNLVDDLEMKHYMDWWNLWDRLMPYRPNMFIYLRPDIDVCMTRLKERNREGESNVSKDYQLQLQKKHDDLLAKGHVNVGANHRIAPVMYLDTDANFRDDMTVRKDLTLQFKKIADLYFAQT